MALSGKSLDAVTAIGPGVALSFHEPKTWFSAQALFTGSPSSGTKFQLEVSLDGVTFSSISFNAGITQQGEILNSGNNPIPAIAVRANLTAYDPTSGDVTVWVAAS